MCMRGRESVGFLEMAIRGGSAGRDEMSDEENSVAPIERVNLKYSSKDQAGQDVEIPFKLLVTGDFSFRPDTMPVGDRKPLEIDKDNFNDVLLAKKIAV